MNNKDLISRSALLEEIRNQFARFKEKAFFKAMCDAERMERAIVYLLNDAPAVDAEVVRHGKWTRLGPNWHECSVCKARTSIFSGTKCYCPNCGAKMNAEVKHEKV